MNERALTRTGGAGVSSQLVILAHDEADARFGRRIAFFSDAGFGVTAMAFTRRGHGGVKAVPESIFWE